MQDSRWKTARPSWTLNQRVSMHEHSKLWCVMTFKVVPTVVISTRCATLGHEFIFFVSFCLMTIRIIFFVPTRQDQYLYIANDAYTV